MRVLAKCFRVLSRKRVDRVLSRLHALEILAQGRPALRGGGAEANETEKRVSLFRILVNPLLQYRPEAVPELEMGLRFRFRLLAQLGQYALDDAGADLR